MCSVFLELMLNETYDIISLYGYSNALNNIIFTKMSIENEKSHKNLVVLLSRALF